MSASNKRFYRDDPSQQYSINSNSTIQKRFCISLVPGVPRGGKNYAQKSSFNRRISSNVDLRINNFPSYSIETTIDTNK